MAAPRTHRETAMAPTPPSAAGEPDGPLLNPSEGNRMRDHRSRRRRRRPWEAAVGAALVLASAGHGSSAAAAAEVKSVDLSSRESDDERRGLDDLGPSVRAEGQSTHRQHQRHRHRTPRHERRGRRTIARPNPWLPDYLTNTCRNDAPADPWAHYPSLPKSAEECCRSHFSWAPASMSCYPESMRWFVAEGGHDGEGDRYGDAGSDGSESGVEYFPDTGKGVCKVATARTPSWITTRESDYGACCRKWLGWNLEGCLKADPAPNAADADSKNGSGKSGGGGDGERGGLVVGAIGRPPAPTPAIVASPTPAAPQGRPAPAVQAEKPELGCDVFTREECERVRAVTDCRWNARADGGRGECVGSGGFAPTTASGGSTVNEENPCQDASQSVCASHPQCLWRRGRCRVDPEYVPLSGFDCPRATKGECLAHAAQCKWHRRAGCAVLDSGIDVQAYVGSGGGSASGGASGSLSSSFMREAEADDRQWHLDPSDGRCKPEGSSWMDVFDAYEKCCAGSWDVSGCVADKSTYFDTGGGGSSQGDNESSNEPVVEVYYDSSDGRCKPNTANRPSWLTLVYTDPRACCQNSWDVGACLSPFLASDGALQPLYADGGSGGGDGGVDMSVPVFLDLHLFGSVKLLTKGLLPSPTSEEWATLKRALTKSLVVTVAGSWWVHDAVEVDLWTLGDAQFTWRRKLAYDSAENARNQEGAARPLLRGAKAVRSKQRHRRLGVDELSFEMIVATLCDGACQSSTAPLGTRPFETIAAHFATAVQDGEFQVTLKEVGESMGLFGDGAPAATAGVLTYRHAVRSNIVGDGSWSPSKAPTLKPVEATNRPTDDVYWPDSKAGVCRAGNVPEFMTDVFGALEDCCNFPWLEYYTCIINSRKAAFLDGLPTARPTRRPTPRPIEATTVYYPDLTLGACKSDGLHGNNPYQFSTASECCTNQWMSYDECMAYADPYSTLPQSSTYYPDIYEGYCRNDGKHVDLNLGEELLYDSAEACCSNRWMAEDCLEKTRNPPGASDDSNCRWHPDPSSFGACTFSADFPSNWDTDANRDMFLHQTHDACCQQSFGGTGCAMNYDCNGANAGPTPSGYVTASPTTAWPTWAPTGPGGSQDTTAPGQPSATPEPTKEPTTTFVVPDVVTTQIDATALTREISDGFENGLDGKFPWHTGPEHPWTVYEDDQTEGSFSARSATGLESGEQSDLYLAINSNHGGVLYFDFKSDVRMPFNGAYIDIDDKSVVGYTYPKEDWLSLTLPVPEGEHVVRFRAWAPNFGQPDVASPNSGTIALDNVSYMPSLFEGFESESQSFEWGEDVQFEGTDWWFDQTTSHEGSASLRSPALSAGQKSTMKFEVTVPRRGADISFWYFGSVGMPYDAFSFQVDGQTLFSIAATASEWKQFRRPLPPGTHVLEWVYERGTSGTAQGDGIVWIDDVGIVGKS